MPKPDKSRPVAPVSASSTEKLISVIRKAEAGDKLAMAKVREAIAVSGNAELLGGNVAREALRKLVAAVSGSNPVLQAATERTIEDMRTELLGPNPTALERLLVERVVATWLHLHHLEVRYASKDSMSLPVGLYYQKSISAAQKRFLAAIKGLAEVRKLALPALQVNIARKQINVATGAVPAT